MAHTKSHKKTRRAKAARASARHGSSLRVARELSKSKRHATPKKDEKNPLQKTVVFTLFNRDDYSKQARARRIRGIIGFFFGLILSVVIYLFKRDLYFSLAAFFLSFFIYIALGYFSNILLKAKEIEKMESVFPDFLQLVAGNLRAGITIDKSILLSSRKEFAPLDTEIARVGKEITTGRSMEDSLIAMGERIGSHKITKTIQLIVSGLQAGGNLAVLLERTSSNMRERGFVEKKAASNVLMYEIFIFVAVAFGAPGLFALSTILVETMTAMLANTPDLGTTSSLNVPFTFSSVDISLTFIIYYSLVFLIAMGVVSSFVIGLVSKGEEKAGLRYLPFIVTFGILTFFVVRIFLSGFVTGIG